MFNKKQIYKRIIGLFVLLACFVWMNPTASNAESFSKDNVSKENQEVSFEWTISKNEYEVKNVQKVNYFSKGFLLTKDDEISLWIKDKEITSWAGKLLDYHESEKELYILHYDIEYLVEIYHFETKEVTHFSPKESKVNGFFFTNQEIILYGRDTLSASFEVWNTTGEYLQSYSFGGLEKNEFNQGLAYPEGYLFALKKDAYANESCFQTIGNQGETKSALIWISKKGIITQELYFNEQTSNEVIQNLIYHNHEIQVELETSNDLIWFSMDEDQTLLHKVTLKKNTTLLFPESLSDVHLQIEKQEEGALLSIFKNETKQTTHFFDEGKYLSCFFEQGRLHLFFQNEEKLVEIIVQELRRTSQKELVCSFDSYQLESYDELGITSDFEKLTYSIQSISPYYEKKMSGDYIITYEIKREDSSTFQTTGQLHVEDYANIHSQEIIPTGYVLDFFGKGYLNNQEILPGYQFDTPGTYHFETKDNEGRIKEYEITVVSNYYKSPNLSEALEVDAEETIQKKYQWSSSKEIEVLVNGTQVTPHFVENDIYIPILTPKAKEVKTYEVQFFYQGEIIYQDDFILQGKTALPCFSFVETSTTNLLPKFTCYTIDEGKTLNKIKVEAYQQNKLVSCLNNYFQKSTIVIDQLIPKEECVVQMKLCYQNQDKEETVDFAEIRFVPKSRSTTLGELSSNIENQTITQITFTQEKQLSLNKVQLGSMDVSNHYVVKKSYLVLGISVAGSLLLVGVTLYLHLSKKTKKKIKVK